MRSCKTKLFGALLLGGLGMACGGCGGGALQEAEAVAAAPIFSGTHPGGPPVVVGRTVDAATGRPIEASLRAPDGSTARSTIEGVFSIKLPEGTAGDLIAETEDGRIGRIVLRPLLGGKLEVVIHLRRARD